MKKESFYKRTISLMIVTLACQGINLLRDILFARKLGPSETNDIYLLSQSIFGIVINMIIVPLTTAYIPVAAKYYSDSCSRNESKKKFVGDAYGCSIVISICVFLIILFLIRPSSVFLAPGFSVNKRQLFEQLLYIQTPIIIFSFIRGLNRGNLQLNNEYVFCEASNILPYIAVNIYLFFTETVNIVICCYIFMIITGLSIIPEFFRLKHFGITIRPVVLFSHDVKSIFMLMGGTAAWAAIKQLNILADKSVGTMLPVGSITHLSYASKLTVVIISLVSASISLVGFTDISKSISSSKIKDVRKEIEIGIELSSLLIIPLVTYLMLFSKNIIEILFVNDQYSLNDAEITSSLMRIYAIGVYFFGIQDILVKVLNALKRVKSTIIVSIINVATNILLDILLYRKYGAQGVAFATTASTIVIILPLIYLVSRNISEMRWGKIALQYGKVAFCALLSYVLVGSIKNSISNSSVAFLGMSTAFLIIFILLCFCFKVESLYNMITPIKQRFSRGKQ